MKYLVTLLLFTLTLFASEPAYLYEDKNSSVTIDYVKENADVIFKSTDDLSKGFSNSAWWLKIDIENPTDEKVDKHLIFEFQLLQKIEAYIIDGKNISTYISGRNLQKNQNNLHAGFNEIEFTMQAHSKKRVFVRIKSDHIIHLQYKLLDTKAAFEYFQNWSITTTLLFSALFFLFVYNFANLIWFKQKIYWYYIVYVFGGIISLLAANNLFTTLFNFGIDDIKFYVFGGMLFYLGLAFFLYELLRDSMPALDVKLHYMIVAIMSVLTIVAIFDSGLANKMFLYGAGLVVTVLFTCIIINALNRQHPLARYILTGWLILSFFLTFFLLSMLGIVGIEYRYFYVYGQIIEGFIFSIIITYQYRFLQVQKKQEQEEIKLAQMGELISMIAHQWRQPLSSISAIASTLTLDISMDNYKKEFFSQRLEDINRLTQHLSSTIDDFRNFFKPNKESIETSLEHVVAKSLDITQELLSNSNIEITTEFNDSINVNVYESELMQVLLNILSNAHDNFIEKKIQNPSLKISTKDNAIIICDNGGGIPEDIISKIFEPYFSTKNEKNGTGLGLYMSKLIIEEHHNGKLSVYNKNGGACFEIIVG
ncbi:hypothetical protein GJV85_00355 [Sulfurimonas aquatica]|uniref:histidine kinase n=1 Tax=Sulfurimonas aquatica TaxID=2672570 RepID=A0A975AY52_9BACT|nr:sensor histidine kinase [Sulfurimonas aquatica]QSZ40630.1 hypothetical protein GJV85_00355 [Sulfurimonas aquatica]